MIQVVGESESTPFVLLLEVDRGQILLDVEDEYGVFVQRARPGFSLTRAASESANIKASGDCV